MKMQNKKPFLARLIDGLFSSFTKEKLLKFLEEKAIKAVLKKFIISGGIKGWIISFVIGEIIEEVDEHLLEPAFRKIGFIADRIEGKTIYKRVENAENRDEWRDSVGDA